MSTGSAWAEIQSVWYDRPALSSDEAACSGMPLELFFPDNPRAAVSVPDDIRETCLNCPLVIQCATWGLLYSDGGIWGGLRVPTRATTPQPGVVKRANKTHCIRGHNEWRVKGNGNRSCIPCARWRKQRQNGA